LLTFVGKTKAKLGPKSGSFQSPLQKGEEARPEAKYRKYNFVGFLGIILRVIRLEVSVWIS
jgi:hypothetical protein